jgi:hypothetical protein
MFNWYSQGFIVVYNPRYINKTEQTIKYNPYRYSNSNSELLSHSNLLQITIFTCMHLLTSSDRSNLSTKYNHIIKYIIYTDAKTV